MTGTSQDVGMTYARYKAGLFRVNTVVSRIKYIGKIGTHFNEQTFARFGWDKAELNEYEEDARINSFGPINEASLLDQEQSLLRREKSNICRYLFWVVADIVTEICKKLGIHGQLRKVRGLVRRAVCTR